MVLVHRHYKNKRLFEELMNRKPEIIQSLVSDNSSEETETGTETELDINPDLVATILKN